MRGIIHFLTLIIIVESFWAQLIMYNRNRVRRLDAQDEEPVPMRMRLRERVNARMQRHREKTTSRVCYDLVGCFEVPHANSPLQKMPEAPEDLDTKFYLFRRNLRFSEPEVLRYDDNATSLRASHFNHKQPVRIYIHGYQSRWNEKGAFLLADAFLKLENANIIIMDWSKGARGPQYAAAAANTEIAGRQLGVLLNQMMKAGLDASKTHLIGFSLGAHVAGCAAETVKNEGLLLGRITGLDPAGPLFRNNHLKDKAKKLDKTDAKFVDIIHTDGSPVFIDGFGLWEPIGHVDYYANGGKQQPGCTDLQASILATTFDKTLNKDNACSHLRAYHLFLESLMSKSAGRKCEFLAYKCPGGLPSFDKGQCFPQIEDKATNPLALDIKYYTDVGRVGIDASGDGVMYFVTRNTPYFCGTQIQANVVINGKTPKTGGVLFVTLQHRNSSTNIQIPTEIGDNSNNVPLYQLATAEYDTLKTSSSVVAHLRYRNYDYRDNNNLTIPTGRHIFMNKLEIKDINAHSWTYCRKPIQIDSEEVSLKLLRNASC